MQAGRARIRGIRARARVSHRRRRREASLKGDLTLRNVIKEILPIDDEGRVVCVLPRFPIKSVTAGEHKKQAAADGVRIGGEAIKEATLVVVFIVRGVPLGRAVIWRAAALAHQAAHGCLYLVLRLACRPSQRTGPRADKGRRAVVDEPQLARAVVIHGVARGHVEVRDAGMMAMGYGVDEHGDDWAGVALGEAAVRLIEHMILQLLPGTAHTKKRGRWRRMSAGAAGRASEQTVLAVWRFAQVARRVQCPRQSRGGEWSARPQCSGRGGARHAARRSS